MNTIMRIYNSPNNEGIRLGFSPSATESGIPEEAIDFFANHISNPSVKRIEPDLDSDCISGLDVVPPPDRITLDILSEQLKEQVLGNLVIKNYVEDLSCAE